MADDIERIRIEIDDSDAKKAQDRVNSGLDAMEAKAGKVSEAATQAADITSRRILSITQTSQNQINRIVAAAEKKAAFASTGPIGRLEAERAISLRRASGDDQAVSRITSAYSRLIAVQKQADNSALLDAAVKSSQRATLATRQFEQALVRVNRAARDGIADLEKRAAFAGKTGIDKLAVEEQFALSKLIGAGSNPANTASVKASFATIRSVQAQADYNASLNKAIAASQRAAVDSDKFTVALNRLNREKQRAIELDQKLEKSTVTASVRRAATEVERIAIDRASALSSVRSPAAISAVNEAFDKLHEKATAGKSFSENIRNFFEHPVQSIGTAVEGVAEKFGKFGLIAGGALIGAGLAAKEAFTVFSEAARTAKEIDQLSNRMGVTTQEALKLDAMAKIARVDISGLEFAMRRLSQALVDGGEEGKRGALALQQIGVNARLSDGNLKGTYQLFSEIAIAIEALPTAAEKTARLAAIFGRGAITLEPMLQKFHEMDDTIGKVGIRMDDDLIKKLAEADSKIALVGIQWERLKGLFAGKILAIIDFEFNVVGKYKSIKEAIQSELHFGDTAHPLPPSFIEIDVVPKLNVKPAIGPAVSPFVGESVTLASRKQEEESIKAGDRMIARFRSQVDTASALQEQITDLERKTREAEAKVIPGQRSDVQSKNIAEVTQLRAATEARKEQLKIVNSIPGRIDQATNYAIAASRLEVTGVAKVIEEYKQKHAELTRGITAGKALLEINTQLNKGATLQVQTEAGKEQRKAALEIAKVAQEESAKSRQYQEEKFKLSQTFEAETLKIQLDTTRTRFSYKDNIAAQSRDRQIRAIENTDAKTLQQKVGFEIQKGRIEAEYVAKHEQIAEEGIQRETDLELALLRSSLTAGVITRGEFATRETALVARTVEQERQLRLSASDDILRVQEQAAIKAADAVRDANTRIFDTFKRESGGIFDAMLTKSQSVFGAIGSALKNVLLTSIKDIVSNQSARLLTELFTGQKVGLTPASVGTGVFSKIGAALGIGVKPTFGNTQSKINQVPMVSSTLGDAVPVIIANPGELGTAIGSIPGLSKFGSDVGGITGAGPLGSWKDWFHQELSPALHFAGSSTGNTSVASTVTTALAALGIKKPTEYSPTTHTPIYEYSAPGFAEAALYKSGRILLNSASPAFATPEGKSTVLRHEETHALLEPSIPSLASDQALQPFISQIRKGLEDISPIYKVKGGLGAESVISEGLAYRTRTADSTIPGLSSDESRQFMLRALQDLDATTVKLYDKLSLGGVTGEYKPLSSASSALYTVDITTNNNIQVKSEKNPNVTVNQLGGGQARAPIAATLALVLSGLLGGGSGTGTGSTSTSQSSSTTERVTSTLGGSGGEGLSGQGGPDIAAILKAGGGGQVGFPDLSKFGSDINGITGRGPLGSGSDIGAGSPNSLISLLGPGGAASQIQQSGLSGYDGAIPSGSGGLGGIAGVLGGSGGSTGGPGGVLGGLLGRLKGLIDPTRAIAIKPGYGTTPGGIAQGVSSRLSGIFGKSIGGVFGKIAGGAAGVAAAVGGPIGLALLTSGIQLAQKNPKSAAAGALTTGGGALAGFSIGSQIPALGAAGGALIGAGAGLLINGYQRGGAVGFAEDIAGGAAIGFKFGGPLGAAIGAGAGAVLGALRWSGIIKSKAEKIHDQIKSLFGVDIRDQGLLARMVQITNQQYGGSVDTAVRGIEIRQLVELYAQATGQQSRGIVAHAVASQFTNQGGKLTALPSYFNGSPVAPGDLQSGVGIPQITPNGSFVTSPIVGGANASTHFNVSLDGPSSAAFLQGQTVQAISNAPRLISSSTASGMKANAGNRQIASSILSPAFLPS